MSDHSHSPSSAGSTPPSTSSFALVEIPSTGVMAVFSTGSAGGDAAMAKPPLDETAPPLTTSTATVNARRASSSSSGSGSSSMSSSFVMLDDDGLEIPKAAQASVLSALHAQKAKVLSAATQRSADETTRRTSSTGASTPPRSEDVVATQNDPSSTSSAASASMTFYNEDEAAFEGRRDCMARRLSALAHASTASSFVLAGGDEDQDDDSEAEEDKDSTHLQQGGKEDEEATNEHEEFEEENEEEEEWILNRILARRVDRHDPAHAFQYLCEWKYYENDPTWETRETLEDLGYKAPVDAMDASKRPDLQQRQARQEQAEAASGTQPCRRNKAKWDSAVDKLHLLKKLPIETALGGTEWLLSEVVAAFRREMPQHWPLEYMPVVPSTRHDAFMRRWEALKATHCPTILYHGTRQSNIHSIIRHSLVVPGKLNVRVEHGSTFGVGIYCDKVPSPLYCDHEGGKQYLFVCVGLVARNHPHVQTHGSYVVFFDESLVMPLWLVSFIQARAFHLPTIPEVEQTVPFQDRALVCQPKRAQYGKHTNYSGLPGHRDYTLLSHTAAAGGPVIHGGGSWAAAAAAEKALPVMTVEHRPLVADAIHVPHVSAAYIPRKRHHEHEQQQRHQKKDDTKQRDDATTTGPDVDTVNQEEAYVAATLAASKLKGMTRRELKQAPRYVKDLVKSGLIGPSTEPKKKRNTAKRGQ